MTTFLRITRRIGLSLFFGTLACLQPLQAQLDPRLAPSGVPSFLDLFQQSSTQRVKPEIVTIFDFSGSMQAIMHHPLYVNRDLTDGDNRSQMTFALSGSNQYTITARSNVSPRVRDDLTIALGSGIISQVHTDTNGTYDMTGITASSTTFAGSTAYTFSAQVTAGTDKVINWTVTGGSLSAPVLNPTTGVSSVVWTLPAQVSVSVTATLDFSGTQTFGSVTAPAFTLTSNELVRPNGDLVTEANVRDNTDTASGLYGASFKEADVRNWVRAASHVRVSYGTHTIDLPIPWKIMGPESTGYPLGSMTVKDEIIKTNADGVTTTTYGSGGQIEMDSTYKVGGGSRVLSGNTSKQTSTTFSEGDYQQFYVYWLLTATASDGKFITYDSANASRSSGQDRVGWGKGFGDFTASESTAKANAIPARTRVQGVKEAAIRTWIKYQKDVFWAFRFLDEVNESADGTATNIKNDSRSLTTSSNVTTTYNVGRDTSWTLLNSDSLGGMSKIAHLFPGTWTPLTYATANALAQFTDPNSVFNDIETGDDAPVQCLKHFLILFTDGLPTKDFSSESHPQSPYITTSGGNTGSALEGNQRLLASGATAYLRAGQKWWNLFTFMGVAAHASDASLGLGNYFTRTTDYPASGTPDLFVPFALRKRGATPAMEFGALHPIQTMTVGVSLGGTPSDPSGPKRRLFLGAALGDPSRQSWDLSALTAFTLKDPADPTKGKTAESINYFDANNPTTLTQSLDYAFQEANRTANTNSTSNPNLPYIGASLGRQIYIGKFKPDKDGAAAWTGDLMMFGTKEVNNQTVVLDKSGNTITILDATNAGWSAAAVLKDSVKNKWTNRKLYTRLPATSTSEPGLTRFSDVDNLASPDANAFTKIKPYIAAGYPLKTTAPTDASKKTTVQWLAGANTDPSSTKDADGRPTTNRENIMGDIINSGPAFLEYKFSDQESKFSSRLSAVSSGKRFRLVLVGTNQGWLHAFGEVTKENASGLIEGAIDELWSFMPTDFLANADYLQVKNNSHRFTVDGTPAIYFLDLPSDTHVTNGLLDYAPRDSAKPDVFERAIAIIGLRKGGRSYYALDIRDPFKPAIKWSLVPDEADFFPSSRIVPGGPSLDTVKSILKTWGYSTSTPAFGRILFNKVVRDAVFLSGGDSLPAVEHNFPIYPLPPTSQRTPLGRSIMALDVYTGEVLAAVDMTSVSSTMGPISTGLVPFEFILNSGMAQRAYFTDFNGGLWAWGSTATYADNPYKDFRIDSSELTAWGTPRKVAQDNTGKNALYSTLPSPFRVGNFPGQGKTDSAAPAAVGISMMSGVRDNPLDLGYASGTKPTQHRLTVYFDRQDSKAWSLDSAGIQDSDLADFSGVSVSSTPTDLCADATWRLITPGCDDYYLAPKTGTPKFGYYINLPAGGLYVPKGINETLVVGGSLFYSYFNPIAADTENCAGGTGTTYSNLICDVINPIKTDTRAGLSCLSGNKFTWTGVASNYFSIGTRGVLQGGVTINTLAPTGTDQTILGLQTISGQSQQRFPKPRVWRTVH